MTIDLHTLRGFVEGREHRKLAHCAARAITKELWALNDCLPDCQSERKWRLSAAYLRELLAPQPKDVDVCTQTKLSSRSDSLALRGTPLSNHPLVCLLNLADAENVEGVHNVLCMLLAQELDITSTWNLKETFGGSNEYADISARSLLVVMAHVKDLERLTKVCNPLNQLLETADAQVVFRHRMVPLTPCFETFMSSLDENVNFSWREAFWLFQRLLSPDSLPSSSMLPQLAVSTLSHISIMNPQHLGHITFLSCILHAIQQAEDMKVDQAQCSHSITAPGPEAADVFLGAVQILSQDLHARLAEAASRVQMSGVGNVQQREQLATEYFTVLAQSRELLSRSQELAALNFSGSLASKLTARISVFMDGLMLNYGVSDGVTELATCLPTGIAIKHPSIGRLLSGIFFRNLPVPERQRLGLTMPTTASIEDCSVGDVRVSFRCSNNSTTAELPWCVLKPMGKLAGAVKLFLKWRLLNRTNHGSARPCEHRYGEDESMSHVPLNVSFSAFGEVLDFAKISNTKAIIGDPVAQQQQFKRIWFAQVASKSVAMQIDILRCATIVGCEEIVGVMQNVQ